MAGPKNGKIRSESGSASLHLSPEPVQRFVCSASGHRSGGGTSKLRSLSASLRRRRYNVQQVPREWIVKGSSAKTRPLTIRSRGTIRRRAATTDRCAAFAPGGRGNVATSLCHAGRDTPTRCQPNGVWFGCNARRGERRRFLHSLSPRSVAQRHALNDRACDAAPRRCVNCNAVLPTTMSVPIDAVPGRGAERPAWSVPLHCDPFDIADEPCSARRRATAQGGRRAAAMNRVGLMLASSARHRTPCSCVSRRSRRGAVSDARAH